MVVHVCRGSGGGGYRDGEMGGARGWERGGGGHIYRVYTQGLRRGINSIFHKLKA